MASRNRSCAVTVLLLGSCASIDALAQADLSGQWTTRRGHEEMAETPGDYSGIPLNDAGRLKADSWSASILTVPEFQCMPHGADLMWNPPDVTGDMRIWKETRLDNEEVVAYHLLVSWMGQHRTIYMDGRPHPNEYAPHTWMGFSTGRWENNVLTIRTTHLKDRWLRRNGVPRSDKATLTERIVRHGDYITWVSIVEDPVFLTEPVIRSVSYIYDPQRAPFPAFECDIAEEIPRPAGEIPHYLPGENPFMTEWSAKYGLPQEAARGGAATMYPEFMRRQRAAQSNR